MIIFSSQIRAARGMLKMSQLELSLETGLSLPTIKNIETEDEAIKKAKFSSITKIKEALEAKGIEFIFNKDESGKISEVGVKISNKIS
jgi:transcriptional regulator with XRE-family HTH domain